MQPHASTSTPGGAPALWHPLITLAQERRRAGDRDGALAAYGEACRHADVPAAAHFNRGNILFEAGRWAEAESAFARAHERDAALAPAVLQLARCALRQGRAEEACERFLQAIRLQPRDYSARLEAGHALRQVGRVEEAIRQYRAALAVGQGRWEAHLALARACEESGRSEEGAVHYHRALPLAARNPGGLRRVHAHMAQYRLEQGRPAAALEAVRQALAAMAREEPAPSRDDGAALQTDLAEILLRLGMQAEAMEALNAASAATAEATLTRLAECALRHNLWQEALQILRHAVALHPESATALWNLAHAQSQSWQLQDALASLARAEALAPQPGAASMRASIAARLGDIDTALGLYTELAEAKGTAPGMASSAAMSSLYSDTLSAEEVAALHRRLFAGLGKDARSVDSFPNDRDRDRPLRIGVVTADMHRQHPVNIFFQPVLARLDQARCPTTVFFTGTAHDEQTRIARGRAAGWLECASLSDAALAQRIAEQRIDILLDLSGHTSQNRMALFGRRAAPVQVTFLGYPGSTGVPNMDWIIGDSEVIPTEHDALCSERVMRLPHAVFCYAPEEDYPFPEFGAAARDRPLVFGSFNNVPKLTPRTMRLWTEILAAVPQSRLLLKAPSFRDEGAIAMFRDRFKAFGADIDRLEFRGPTDLRSMMAEYADIDIALDPLPYNGGTTTLQAMWMGAPVLVRRGNAFVSRMGASFMTAAGLPDWVARDDADYVRIAQSVAQDRSALLELKRGMRDRLLARPAWQIDRYAEDFQAALRSIWHMHCDGHRGGEASATRRRSKARSATARA